MDMFEDEFDEFDWDLLDEFDDEFDWDLIAEGINDQWEYELELMWRE